MRGLLAVLTRPLAGPFGAHSRSTRNASVPLIQKLNVITCMPRFFARLRLASRPAHDVLHEPLNQGD